MKFFQQKYEHVIVKKQVKPFYKLLATLVKSDLKAPFSIATPLRCRGGCYSFPWIDPLYP